MEENQSLLQAHAAFMASSAHMLQTLLSAHLMLPKLCLKFRRNVQVVQSPSGGPMQIFRELRDQILVENGFNAQMRSIQTEDNMIGSLLDIRN